MTREQVVKIERKTALANESRLHIPDARLPLQMVQPMAYRENVTSHGIDSGAMTLLEQIARAVNPTFQQMSRNDRRNALITARAHMREVTRVILEMPKSNATCTGVIDLLMPITVVEIPR